MDPVAQAATATVAGVVLGERKLAALLALALLLGQHGQQAGVPSPLGQVHGQAARAQLLHLSQHVTTTVNGTVITGTTFGIQALETTGSSSGSASGSAAAGSTASLIDTAKVLTFSGLVAGSMFTLMVAL